MSPADRSYSPVHSLEPAHCSKFCFKPMLRSFCRTLTCDSVRWYRDAASSRCITICGADWTCLGQPPRLERVSSVRAYIFDQHSRLVDRPKGATGQHTLGSDLGSTFCDSESLIAEYCDRLFGVGLSEPGDFKSGRLGLLHDSDVKLKASTARVFVVSTMSRKNSLGSRNHPKII